MVEDLEREDRPRVGFLNRIDLAFWVEVEIVLDSSRSVCSWIILSNAWTLAWSIILVLEIYEIYPKGLTQISSKSNSSLQRQHESADTSYLPLLVDPPVIEDI